ncbi:cell division protein FtsH [Mycobacterium tuberculosis]|nr:cell division protein FtsH [Mycobacterium tuberculosis]
MNRKNVTRTITAIAVVVLLGWSFFYFSDDTRGYKPVDTSVAITQINGDNVKSAQIDDREQQLRLILKKGNNETDGSEKVITKYPTGYAATCSTRSAPKTRRSARSSTRAASWASCWSTCCRCCCWWGCS